MKYVTNDGTDVIYVGGKAIPPGEGREIEDDVLPPELKAPVQTTSEEEPEDLYAKAREVLKGNVDAVKAALQGLPKDELDRIQELEQAAKKPRAGVLTALADAQIALADAKLKSDDLGGGDGAGDDTKKPE